jgi:hypothetical protein
MKTHYGIALVVASALAFSTLAHADTLPAGAERFNLYMPNGALDPIDIPKGRTLVITDIIIPSGPPCTFIDGTEPKVTAFNATPLHFQTGVEFRTRLATYLQPCFTVFLSGYWLDATANL